MLLTTNRLNNSKEINLSVKIYFNFVLKQICQMKRITIIISLVLMVYCQPVFAQLSRGGYPLQLTQLKSTANKIKYMPAIDNRQMLQKSVERYQKASVLKPFKFAHSFEVNFTPKNSGEYLESYNGKNIWQLRIKSENALSLNLIFDPFVIPPGAKLFVMNPEGTDILGAFTEFNNKSFKSFAVSPLAGDELILQYEEPENAAFEGEIAVKNVNHDFMGILVAGDKRRPLGISGSCNLDINCELAKDWDKIKNSVCRLIVKGVEICTGSLINNTSEDGTPYVITANHCFEDYTNAEQNTVYLFNYESPYCGALDGSNSNSISGSIAVANSDSLDFSLVELTQVPPPEFRPYYLGWDRSGTIPDSVTSIHHPIGDIKKIAIDYDSPVIASFQNEYLSNAFWKTLKWDIGTTEAGSSGGAYLNTNQRLIGTLTGGLASCSNSIDDYFARFDMSWDYFADSTQQLKHWLDPQKIGDETLDGLEIYEGEDICDAFTNLMEGDSPGLLKMLNGESAYAGYWGGTNSQGITEFVEKFSIPGDESLEGVSLGIGKLDKNSSSENSFITINVYNGADFPEELIYTQDVSFYGFQESAMNYVPFDESLSSADTFFVGINYSNVNAADSLALLIAFRKNNPVNSLLYLSDGAWYNFAEGQDTVTAAMAIEMVACNVIETVTDTPVVSNNFEIEVYPNPFVSELTLTVSQPVEISQIKVFDLLGKEINVSVQQSGMLKFNVSFSGNRRGLYFVSIRGDDFDAVKKVSYFP